MTEATAAVAAWQQCPVCYGSGAVSRPPGLAGDIPTWSSTALSRQCPTCKGARIISTVTGLPPQWASASAPEGGDDCEWEEYVPSQPAPAASEAEQ